MRYAASCFVNKALTWWNTQVQARGREAVIGMSWNDFRAFLVEELCPSNEMEKLENEFWNHTIVGANHVAFTDRFHELAKLVPHLVTTESSCIKRMEQYLTFTDHSLWEVIVNGDSVSPVASASVDAEGPIPPKTAEQNLARKNELKAKSTLMLAIPNEHLLKFYACNDAKCNTPRNVCRSEILSGGVTS
nr:reverse transcriptase domain-containing protein [Tanacetum cinerariifolium]